MAVKAVLTVRPRSGDDRSEAASGLERAYARFSFSRLVTINEDEAAGDGREGAGREGDGGATTGALTESTTATERIPLDAAGSATLQVDHLDDVGPASARIENSQGEVLWPGGVFPLEFAEAEGDDRQVARATLEYDPAPVAKQLDRPPPPRVDVLRRDGQFRRLVGAARGFEYSRLQVAPLADAESMLMPFLGDRVDPDRAATKLLDATALDAAALSTLPFVVANLKTDGGFHVDAALPDGARGWAWLLTEPGAAYIGWVPETAPQRPRESVLILLPPSPSDVSDRGTGNGTGTGTGMGGAAPAAPGADGPAGKRGCDCGTAPPLDFDESQLIRDPAEFADDPGRYCTPFENPQRVLGERRFFTVFRVDQPDIGAAPSGRDDKLPLHDLVASTMVRPTLAIAARTRRAEASGGGTAAELLDLSPASHLIKSPQRRLRLIASSGVRAPVSAANPVEWEGESAIYQATSVAGGHILEWAVQWRSNGYSLGDVAHTLTLAPRQKRRVVRVDWERRERARRTERTTFVEEVEQTTERERDYNNAVRANLREWSQGSSRSSATGAAGGIGFAIGPVVVGGGAAHGQASSSASQSGGRALAASEEQSLRDAIRQFGDSLRQFESTVVQEVTQEEAVEGVSEVVYNINYCHSLTVIYHQILRHLRVDTRLVGVRECLFVPFAVRPFDLKRALRWRDLLRHGVRDRGFRQALDYLDEVADNFSDSDIPPGPRSTHPVRFVSGSLYVRIAIERPTDDEEQREAEWLRVSRLLGMPYRQVVERLLAAAKERRDAEFQRDVAPTMAVRWANRLRLSTGAGPIGNVDFTLASGYGFNRTVRVEFAIPVPEGATLTRANLAQITVTADPEVPLPKGSVANVERIEITYQTDQFSRSVSSARRTDDLVHVDSGDPDPAGAVLSLPLTAWEQQDERAQIVKAVDRLLAHLNANTEYYHKTIWWNLDRDRLYMMLDGFLIGFGPSTGRSIASVVEREPIAILGNALVYPVSAGAFIGVGGRKTPQDALDYYQESDRPRAPVRVSLPTQGLYAQAIMDRCVACEEHQGSLDWVLTQDEPELAELGEGLLASRRADTDGTQPTPFPGSIINFQNAPEAPPPTGLGSILDAVTKGDSFRDMAGLAGTQANAMGALQAAAGLAESFGQKGLELRKAEMATKQAEQRLANIKKANDQGLITRQEAGELARQTLAEQTTAAPESRVSREAPVAQAIETAGRTGAPIEVMRTTAAGTERVALNQRPAGELTAQLGSEIPRLCGFFNNGKVVTEQDLRDKIVALAELESATWHDAGGNLQLEGEDARFGDLVWYWLASNATMRPSTLTAAQANAIDPARNYGRLLDPRNPAPPAAALTADVTRVRGELLAGAPNAHVPANLNDLVEVSLRHARESAIDHGDHTAWSGVFVVSCVRGAAIDLGLEEDAASHTGVNVLLLASFRHSEYVLEAFERRRANRRGTYHAFEVDRRAVQAGDIVVLDRQANDIRQVVRFNQIPVVLPQRRAMHCDIIVSVNEGAGYAEAIGGNVGETVRRVRYPIDGDGRLVVRRDHLFTIEQADGTIDDPPEVNAAAGLNGRSTGRIFAVLSLVPECIVVPGTRLPDGSVIT